MDRVTVAIGLGSNLGNREAHIEFAHGRLSALLSNLRLSSLYDTTPIGVSGPQPMFLNAAAVGATTLPARALLDALLAIERSRGRTRPFVGAPRTLDLDLLLFGEAIICEEGLTVPHPRFRDRGFVLEPLSEVAPELRDPVTGRSIGELFSDWQRAQ